MTWLHKIYIAAISAPRPHRGEIGWEARSGHQVYLGGQELYPPRPSSLPSWDLVLVLRALQAAPFEPLQSVELKFLFLKTLLLTKLASIKRLGDRPAGIFGSTNRALSLGWLTPVQHWDPGPAMCPRFLPLPSGTRWWTSKCCPWRRQTQPKLWSVLYMHCDSTCIELKALVKSHLFI